MNETHLERLLMQRAREVCDLELRVADLTSDLAYYKAKFRELEVELGELARHNDFQDLIHARD